MIRLHIITEGKTEQKFADNVLKPHLSKFMVMVDARCVLTNKDKRRNRIFRGGLVRYVKAKQDIQDWLKEDNHLECRFTTMFDLYALPKDFPGYAEAHAQRDAYKKIAILEKYLREDIGDKRFIPYIQMHEFESLILADPQQLGYEYMDCEEGISKLIEMVDGKNPELINSGPETAPSKRILREIPEYDKVTAGPIIAQKIGLSKLRTKCRHFHEWLSALEKLNS